VRTATEMLRPTDIAAATASVQCYRDVAWVNQATCCRAHFGPKSAPRHRDFGPRKVGDIS